MEATKSLLTEEWIKNMCYISTLKDVYKKDIKAIKAIKRWNNAICSNMDGPRDCHNWLKLVGERQILSDTTYMWTLKNVTNEHIYKTEIVTDVESKLRVTDGDGWREGLNW